MKICVRDTAIDSVRAALRAKEFDSSATHDADITPSSAPSVPSAALESRQLPALVVRCAQHILTWGVQELGLFRYDLVCYQRIFVSFFLFSVNGRSSHVAKLRSEFDTGKIHASMQLDWLLLCSQVPTLTLLNAVLVISTLMLWHPFLRPTSVNVRD
jgi:hypothetical protein